MYLIAYNHTDSSSTVSLPGDLWGLKEHKAKTLKTGIDINPSSGQQATRKSYLDWFQNPRLPQCFWTPMRPES